MLQILLLAATLTSFPSQYKTSWMTPDAFHLSIGMSRAEAVKQLERGGWKTAVDKKVPEHLVVIYADGKSLTLAFEKDTLQSVRFELVDFLPQVKEAYSEQKELLDHRLGRPSKTASTGKLLIYDSRRPNVFVVMSTSHQSKFGKQGLGFLVVRYFEPPPPK